MLEGTDAAILYILFGYPAMQKNLLVAERKIEMPLQRLNDVALGSQTFTFSWVGREGSIRTLGAFGPSART